MDRLIDTAMNLGIVVAILLVGWLVAKWLRRLVQKVLGKVWRKYKAKAKKIGLTLDVPKIASTATYYLVMYIVVTSALKRLGVDLSIIENFVDTVVSLVPIALVADWVLNDLKRTKKLLKLK